MLEISIFCLKDVTRCTPHPKIKKFNIWLSRAIFRTLEDYQLYFQQKCLFQRDKSDLSPKTSIFSGHIFISWICGLWVNSRVPLEIRLNFEKYCFLFRFRFSIFHTKNVFQKIIVSYKVRRFAKIQKAGHETKFWKKSIFSTLGTSTFRNFHFWKKQSWYSWRAQKIALVHRKLVSSKVAIWQKSSFFVVFDTLFGLFYLE